MAGRPREPRTGGAGAERAGADPGPPRLAPEPASGWEQVEAGRYRPLRTRGSFPGRELG
jgi:hypothetical protein